MITYNSIESTIVEKYSLSEEEKIQLLIENELVQWRMKIIVLDDDPTGVQTVHDVPVYTSWAEEDIKDILNEESKLVYILTNSRSFSESKTREVHQLLAEELQQISEVMNQEILVISRGDSTLRGHYLLELQALSEGFKQRGKEFHGQIFCPFFLEGGRYTINGIHYVKDGDALIPAGNTEFAKDKTFGYRSSDLGEFVEEKSNGMWLKSECIYITIELLRNQKFEDIYQLLCQSKNFQPIIVDALEETDLKVFSICLLRAMKEEKKFLIRCAATLPKILGNVSDQPLLQQKDIFDQKEIPMGGLIIVGSHVKKTTEQLNALKNTSSNMKFYEFDVNSCFKVNGLDEERDRLIHMAEASILEGKTAVIYTSRILIAPRDKSAEELLALSVDISDALTGIVTFLKVKPKFLIAKGGITSSDVGTKGLGVKKAWVMGQIYPGIPVWKIGNESKFSGLAYIIFPGNVGNETTLRDIAYMLDKR